MAKFKEAKTIDFTPCENCKQIHITMLNGKGKEFAGITMDLDGSKEIFSSLLKDISDIEAGRPLPAERVEIAGGHKN